MDNAGFSRRDDTEESSALGPRGLTMGGAMMEDIAVRVQRIEAVVMMLLGQLRPKLKGFSGLFANRLVNKVAARFERDHIDEETLRYIVVKVLVEMGFIRQEDAALAELTGERKARAERIVYDVVAVMKSTVASAIFAVIGQEGPAEALSALKQNLDTAGLSSDAMSEVICALWSRVRP